MKIKLTKEQLAKLSEEYSKKNYSNFVNEISRICETLPGVTVRYLDEEFDAIGRSVLDHKDRSNLTLDEFIRLLGEAKRQARVISRDDSRPRAPQENQDLKGPEILPELEDSFKKMINALEDYGTLVKSMQEGYKSCLTLSDEPKVSRKERKCFGFTLRTETETSKETRKYFFESDKDLVAGIIKQLKLPIKNREIGVDNFIPAKLKLNLNYWKFEYWDKAWTVILGANGQRANKKNYG